MQTIPLLSVPNQKLRVRLDGQTCFIHVYQKSQGLFLDLSMDDTPIVTGVLCRDLAFLLLANYLGFKGNLVFIDVAGASDPYYTGLADRYILFYYTQSEIDALV